MITNEGGRAYLLYVKFLIIKRNLFIRELFNDIPSGSGGRLTGKLCDYYINTAPL